MISTPSVSPSTTGASAAGQRLELAAGIGKVSADQNGAEAQGMTSDPHGSAVVISLSEESDVRLNEVQRNMEEMSRKSSIQATKHSIQINTSIVNFEKERIDFLENVEPAAPRVLTGDEAKETLRMLEAFKEGDVLMGVSETGRRSWTVDGMSYALYPDGTLTAGEAGVPTSEEERQLWLETSRERYNRSYEGLMRAQESLAELGYDGNEVVA